MTRQRNRHDLASTRPTELRQTLQMGTINETSRTVFDLRVIERDRFLGVRTTDLSRLRYWKERRDPPQRKQYEANEEAPRMGR